MSEGGQVFRLIVDGPGSGTWNMAVDEALLESACRDRAFRPTLRFYSWNAPCLSVGYFQSLSEVSRRLKARAAVRRISGGGTVVHGEDLTFSLTLRHPGPHLPGDVKASYLRINEALRTGLGAMFPALDFAPCSDAPSGRAKGGRVCFEEPSCYDLMIGRRKVVGSSQRRRDEALLHQASVFLKEDPKRLIDAIVSGWKKSWSVHFERTALSAAEREDAARLEVERYGLSDWALPPAR